MITPKSSSSASEAWHLRLRVHREHEHCRRGLTTMRTLALSVLVAVLFACTHVPLRSAAESEPAAVAFHVLGLKKTPSGAT